MPLSASYYGLIRGNVDRPADSFVVDAASSQLDIAAPQLTMVSSGTTEHFIAPSPSRLQIESIGLLMVSSGVDEHVVGASPSPMQMQPVLLGIVSSGVDQHEILSSPSRLYIAALQLTLSSSGTDVHEIAATPSQIEMVPDKMSITSSLVEDHVIAASPSRLDLSPDKLSLSSTSTDEHVILVSPSPMRMDAVALTLASSGTDEHFIVASPSPLSMDAVQLSIASSGTDQHVIASSPSRMGIATDKLSITSSGTGEHVIAASPSQLSMSPVALSMSSSGVDQHEITATPSRLQMDAEQLTMSSSGVDEHQITASPSRLAVSPVELAITSTLVAGEAACFQGAGYMYSDDMPGGYNLAPDSGYVSLYFRYQGGNPDELFLWKNTLFQAHRADESHLEFRLEALSTGGAYPDLVIESNDDTGTFALATDLETDGGPYLYDGNWHHLLFGNDFGGQGWYFFVDGQRYEGRTGSNQGVWFKHVQANTAVGNFEEVDLVATRVQAPGGTQNLYGCVDEVLVVNDRLWVLVDTHDREYLYNDGYGRLIEDVEANNPTGIWSAVFNAWRLRQDQNEQFGYEYRDPDSTERYSLTTFGYVIVTDGIPGASP